jgi:hypothetical protein
LGRTRRRQFRERQVGNHPACGTGIDDDLFSPVEQPFQSFEINALAGDVRRFLVLLVNLEETRRLARGFRDRLLAVSFCSLGEPYGFVRGLSPAFEITGAASGDARKRIRALAAAGSLTLLVSAPAKKIVG